MNTKTTVATTHRTVLAPEEWFTVKLAGDRVMSVDGVDVGQTTEDGQWNVTLYGNRVLKSGAFGQRLHAGTWEHSNSFSEPGRRALWAVLPAALRARLVDLGVRV